MKLEFAFGESTKSYQDTDYTNVNFKFMYVRVLLYKVVAF